MFTGWSLGRRWCGSCTSHCVPTVVGAPPDAEPVASEGCVCPLPSHRAASVALVVLAGLTGSAIASAATATADADSCRDEVGPRTSSTCSATAWVHHVTAARERYYGADGHLVMESLARPARFDLRRREEVGPARRGRLLPNLVTDSASAATAWASGVKTYNAALGIDAKGKPSRRDGLAKRAGYRTGNVSTAEITDATPAGQMSHAPRAVARVRVLRGRLSGPRRQRGPASRGRRPGHPDRGPDRAERHRRRHPRWRVVAL